MPRCSAKKQRERDGLELIPSENYAFPEIYATNGSVFANKYAEGYPGRRYYGGQEFTDRIETLAIERAKSLFRAEHANVQPLERLADEPSRLHGVPECRATPCSRWICRMADI